MSSISICFSKTTRHQLWKEIRILLPVWSACAAGFVGLLIFADVLFTFLRIVHDDLSRFLWGISIWMPPVYLLAAMSLMFAGEREARTSDWSLFLAPGWRRSTAIKVLAPALSGFLLQGLAAITALLLVGPPSNDLIPSIEYAVSLLLLLLFETMFWSWFWSLLTRQTFIAMLLAGVSLVQSEWLFFVLTEGRSFSSGKLHGIVGPIAFGHWGWGRIAFYLMLAIGSLKLSQRWHEGLYCGWTTIGRTRSGDSRCNRLPPEATEPWKREWQRLRWLEWQGLRWPLRAVLLAVAATASEAATTSIDGPLTLPLSSTFLIAFFFGYLAWRGDNADLRTRMLVNQGVSPLGFWIQKFLMWSAATLGGILAITAAGFISGYFSDLVKDGPSWMEDHFQHFASRAFPFARGGENLIAANLAMMSTVFCIPWTVSHLVRKTVTSLGIAFLCACILIVVLIVIHMMRLPAVFLLMPIAGASIFLSMTELDRWWLEIPGGPWSRRRFMNIVIVGLTGPALIVGTAFYLVESVPSAPFHRIPGIERIEKICLDPNLVTSRPDPYVEILKHLETEPTFQELREAGNQVYVNTPGNVKIYNPIIFANNVHSIYKNPEWKSEIAKHSEEISQLAKKILAIQISNDELIEPYTLQSLDMYRTVTEALGQQAMIALSEGRSDDSILSLRAILRLHAGMISNTSPSPIESSTRHVCESVSSWATAPEQSEDLLRRGLTELAAEVATLVPRRGQLLANRQMELKWIDEFDTVAHVRSGWIARNRAKRRANVRLYNALTCRLLGLAEKFPLSSDLEPLNKSRNFDVPFAIPPLISCPPAPEIFGYNSIEDLPSLNDVAVCYPPLTFGRMVMTSAAAAGFQRIHGHLPGSLDEIKDYFGSREETILDPWSGQAFIYQPSGLSGLEGKWLEESTIRGPFLWTGAARYSRLAAINGKVIVDINEPRSFRRMHELKPGEFQGFFMTISSPDE